MRRVTIWKLAGELTLRGGILALVGCAVAGCSGGKEAAPVAPSASASATADGAATAVATASAPGEGGGRSVKDESALYSFEYAYPDAAGAIPALRARLEADLATQQGKLRRDAKADQTKAKADGFPYHAWYWSQKWSVVTDLPGWLSLSAEYGNYTGGAHGMYWFGAMLWDKRANVPRDPLTLFTSKAALSEALRGAFCAGLNEQRRRKRGIAVDPKSTEEFDKCIDPVGETVILGSKGRQAFDRIGILVPPYEAGPYAEGSYEVTVPVTAAVIAAVKPEFRASFAMSK